MSKVQFTSVTQMQKAVKANGGHFFDRDTMRHWGTVIHGGIFGGHFFVTSDWVDPFEHGAGRVYRVRWFEDTQSEAGIWLNERAGGFSDEAVARQAAQKLAKGLNEDGTITVRLHADFKGQRLSAAAQIYPGREDWVMAAREWVDNTKPATDRFWSGVPDEDVDYDELTDYTVSMEG